MDIRIGIQNSPREITFESDTAVKDVEESVANAVSGASACLRLTDSKGNVFLVPSAALAYVEIGTEESRRIGFVA